MHRTLGQQLNGARDAIVQICGGEGRIKECRAGWAGECRVGGEAALASLLQPLAAIGGGGCRFQCGVLSLAPSRTHPPARPIEKPQPAPPPTRVEVSAEEQRGALAAQQPRRQLAIRQCLLNEGVRLLLQVGMSMRWVRHGVRVEIRVRVRAWHAQAASAAAVAAAL